MSDLITKVKNKVNTLFQYSYFLLLVLNIKLLFSDSKSNVATIYILRYLITIDTTSH